MATNQKILRRNTGAAGGPAALLAGQLAMNEVDGVLYYGNGDSSGNATSVIPIAGKGAFVDLSSTQTVAGVKTFSSSPVLPTPAADTNSTVAATTAYVLGQLASTTSPMSGTAAVGTSTRAARADHVHPTDTSRAPLASPAFTGTPTAPTPAAGDNSTTLATTAFVTGAVQSAAAGIDSKASVRALASANITLSGTQTVDGVALVAGDRVLCVGQTTASANGVYVVAAGAWSRAVDADATGEITPGAFWYVEAGTSYGATQWRCSNTGTITLGTTSITITQFGAAVSYTAGNGLSLGGNAFSVVGTTNRISVSGAGVDISASYAGQTSIITLGVVTTGTWSASIIGLAYGGTGANLSAIADGTLFKKSGTGFVAAVAGTDYLSPTSTIDGGTF